MMNAKYFEINFEYTYEIVGVLSDGTEVVRENVEGEVSLYNRNGIKEDVISFQDKEALERIISACKEAGASDLEEEVRKGREAQNWKEEGRRQAALLRRHDGDFEEEVWER